jgi:hypothetical protein
LAAIVAAGALAACASAGNSNVPRPQLAGTWVFNEAESQNPDSMFARAGNPGQRPTGRGGAGGVIDGGRGGGARGGGGRGGVGGGMGGGAGGRGLFGGAGRELDPGRIRAVLGVLAQERRGLVVRQTADSLTFTFADDFPIRYTPNGKKEKRTLPGLGETEVKAEWKDGLLIVERKLEDDIEIRDEFVRGPDSPRLVVNTTVSGLAPRELALRTVFERSAG